MSSASQPPNPSAPNAAGRRRNRTGCRIENRGCNLRSSRGTAFRLQGCARALVLLACLAGCLVASVQAQSDAPLPKAPVPGPAAPKIVFDSTMFDFGKADAGTMVTHDFFFTNTGNAALEVTDVRPGCGCTTAGAWDRQVEPGKSGRIPIQFNSMGYGGAVQKAVSVTCNDPAKKNITLQLKGTIWKPVDVNPQFAMFNLMPEGQTNETHVVKIHSNLDEPLTLSEPTCSSPSFRLELRTIKPGKEFDLEVTVLPPLPAGNVSAPISVKTSSAKLPVLTLTAFAVVQPVIALTPPQLSLPQGPLAKALQLNLTIQNNATNALVLSEPAVNVSGVEAQLKEFQPGRQFNLTLSFPAGFQSKPDQPMEVSLKSNHPQYPLLKIPVMQISAPAAVSAAPAPSHVNPPPAPSNPAPALRVTPPSALSAPVPSRQPASEKPSDIGPSIGFAESAFDFGRVESGKVVRHEFTFTNAGNQVLEIRDVASSCGCTATAEYSRRVEPGGSGLLPVIFNTGGMSGPVRKTLSVVCNDPSRPRVMLEISATVWKSIDALPAVAAFTFGPDSQTNETRVIRLVNNLETPVTLGPPLWTNRSFRADLATVQAGKEFELLVTVMPPLGPGSTLCPITIPTSSPKMPQVTVNAYAIVQPALTVSPPRLTLPKTPLTNEARVTVTIQNRSTNALALSEPAINAQGAEVRVQEVQPGLLFNLTVTFPAGFQLPAGEEVEARIKSNFPQFPYVTIPVGKLRRLLE